MARPSQKRRPRARESFFIRRVCACAGRGGYDGKGVVVLRDAADAQSRARVRAEPLSGGISSFPHNARTPLGILYVSKRALAQVP